MTDWSQWTLILLKPDCLRRRLVEPVLSAIGLHVTVLGKRVAYPTEQQIFAHYDDMLPLSGQLGLDVPAELRRIYVGQPTGLALGHGPDAAARVRALLGHTDPSLADRGPKQRRNHDKRAFQHAVTTALPTLATTCGGLLVVAGDLNVVERGHQPHHAVFGDWEYAFYDAFTAAGLTDAFRAVHPDTAADHSWFGRSGNGYRFDHTFLTASHRDQLIACDYLHQPRIAGLSDHSALRLTACLPAQRAARPAMDSGLVSDKPATWLPIIQANTRNERSQNPPHTQGVSVRHRVIEQLTLTDEQYDAVVAGLAVHRPDLALPHDIWLDPASWELIPDRGGRPSKAELYVYRATSLQEGHTIVNVWLADDLRDPDWGHSHPAAFDSHILLGAGATGAAYTEVRYTWLNGAVRTEELTHRQGRTNTFPLHQFHRVVDVAPGSVTLMDWGPIVQAKRWGYLNPDTAEFLPARPDPRFRAPRRPQPPPHVPGGAVNALTPGGGVYRRLPGDGRSWVVVALG